MNCLVCHGTGRVHGGPGYGLPCIAEGCHGGTAHCCEGDREQPPSGTATVRLGPPRPRTNGGCVVVRP